MLWYVIPQLFFYIFMILRARTRFWILIIETVGIRVRSWAHNFGRRRNTVSKCSQLSVRVWTWMMMPWVCAKCTKCSLSASYSWLHNSQTSGVMLNTHHWDCQAEDWGVEFDLLLSIWASSINPGHDSLSAVNPRSIDRASRTMWYVVSQSFVSIFMCLRRKNRWLIIERDGSRMDGWITCLRQLGRVVDLKKTFCQHLWNESARLQRVRPGILAPQLRFQLSSHM